MSELPWALWFFIGSLALLGFCGLYFLWKEGNRQQEEWAALTDAQRGERIFSMAVRRYGQENVQSMFRYVLPKAPPIKKVTGVMSDYAMQDFTHLQEIKQIENTKASGNT